MDDRELIEPMDEASLPGSEQAGPDVRDKGGLPPEPVRKKRQYRLNQLMMASVGFAIVFFFVGQAIRSGQEDDAILAGVVVSLGVMVLGFLLIRESTRRSWLGWTFAFVGVLGATGLGIGWPSLILVVILFMSLSHIIARYRVMQQDALLWSIALAADRSMPLAPAVEAFSRQLGWGYRRKGREVAECLANGLPLPDALELVDKAATPPAIVLARVGWDSGGLPQAMKLATTERLTRGPNSQDFSSKISYLSMMLLALQFVIGFLMYFIMPRFEAIFREFGAPLPVMTQAVISASNAVAGIGLLPVLLVLQILLVIYLPFAINGWGSLSIPLIDRFFIRRHRILILKALSVVVDAGQPVALGILSLSRGYPTGWVRRRLATAWQGIEAGHGWADALSAVGMLARSDSEVLCSAERVGNLPWAVRELAQTTDRRHAQRLELVAQVFFVLVIVAIGALVGVLAVSYFMPLVNLISRLSA